MFDRFKLTAEKRDRPSRPSLAQQKMAFPHSLDPKPTMIASQSSMVESFDSNALASMGFGPNGLPIGASTSPHWIKFALSEKGNCEGLQCAAHFADGTVEHGTFDANNTIRFARETSSPCTRVEILQNKGDPAWGSVLGDLMGAMLG